MQVGFEHQYFDVREAEPGGSAVGGPDIRTFVEGAAATIQHDFAVARQRAQGLGERFESLRFRAWPRQNGVLDVRAAVEDGKTYIKDGRLRFRGDEIERSKERRRGPGVGRLLRGERQGSEQWNDKCFQHGLH